MATVRYKVNDVDYIFVEGLLTPEEFGIMFDVDFTAEDTKDVTFPNGFMFSGDYDVELTGYWLEDDAPVIITIVPRGGDPTPPAAKAPDGFRLVLQAASTGRVRIWVHQ